MNENDYQKRIIEIIKKINDIKVLSRILDFVVAVYNKWILMKNREGDADRFLD